MQRNVSVLSVVVSLWFVAACCSAPTAPAETRVVTPDCTPPPPRACCRAMTEKCLTCVDDAKKEREAFHARCPDVVLPAASEANKAEANPSEAAPTVDGPTGPGDIAPSDPQLQAAVPDCSVPFDAPMCCMAETPECIACRNGALKKQAAWETQCNPGAPPRAFDCSKPFEGTSCCRALLPKCTDCVEANKKNRAAYDAFCGTR